MASIAKEIQITVNTEELDRLAIGGRLYDMFAWSKNRINFNQIISSDRETKDIVIKESELLKLIQLVNPGQPDRHIKLIKDL